MCVKTVSFYLISCKSGTTVLGTTPSETSSGRPGSETFVFAKCTCTSLNEIPFPTEGQVPNLQAGGSNGINYGSDNMLHPRQ
ncbi:unnamed protein product [Allacma fusca]|uniref:Uncharacterized protein n=1 Tax=Allacma fusca TaxID=39272 RepID=A0A8J2MH44_9HEXA|nr:unnamed protein product [Allacma fusca]